MQAGFCSMIVLWFHRNLINNDGRSVVLFFEYKWANQRNVNISLKVNSVLFFSHRVATVLLVVYTTSKVYLHSVYASCFLCYWECQCYEICFYLPFVMTCFFTLPRSNAFFIISMNNNNNYYYSNRLPGWMLIFCSRLPYSRPGRFGSIVYGVPWFPWVSIGFSDLRWSIAACLIQVFRRRIT